MGVDPDPARASELKDWTIGYWEALHPYSAGGAYVNMMMDEGQERVQAAYRDNYARLVRGQEHLRSYQLLPRQPEHRAHRLTSRPWQRRTPARHVAQVSVYLFSE